jgi:hypothetical protein
VELLTIQIRLLVCSVDKAEEIGLDWWKTDPRLSSGANHHGLDGFADKLEAVERAPAGSSLVDVLDRVLDKGIVIDAYVRVTLVGIDLIGVEARIVVASVETYLKYSDQIGVTAGAARPGLGHITEELERVRSENTELRRRLSVRNS